MKEVRKILVGLDLGPKGAELTPGSRRAVETALWLAKSIGARVELFHSSARDEYYDHVEGDFVIVHDGLSDEGSASLDAVLAEFRQEGLRCELIVVEERPGDAIIQRVDAESVQLVIVGKRTAADTDNRRLGSLSRRLLTECPAAAVWVVKPDDSPQPETILAACDLDAVGRRVLRASAQLTRFSSAKLHVLHALQVSLSVQMDADRERLCKELKQKASLELHERLAELDPEIEAKTKFHVGVDSPSHAILMAEKKFEPDLVVFGTVSRKGVAGWILGSTAARMVDRLDCSLLAIKPEIATAGES